MQFNAADKWRVVVGGTAALEVAQLTTTIFNNLSVSGTTTVSGNTNLNGNTTLGNASTDIITMTGQLISTRANSTATGGGQIYLNGTTGNRIDFNTSGTCRSLHLQLGAQEQN
jgi:hypothetical protein